MTKFALMLAAAGMLLAAPTFTTTQANAKEYLDGAQMAQVSINVGERRGRRVYRERRCNTKVIYRNGRKTVIRNCR